MKKISVVSITYNEEKNVQNLYNAVLSVFEQLPQYDYEFIVADNCSTDNTLEILRKLAKQNEKFKVIVNANNFGATRSQFNALLAASGDAIIIIPADLQVPPAIFPELLKKWEEGYEVVCATYKSPQKSFFIMGLRKLYYVIMDKFSETPHIANFTGPGLYDKRFLAALRKYTEPNPYLRGLVGEIGFKQTTVSYTKMQRVAGVSKYKLYAMYDVAVTGIVNHSKIPMRLTSFLGWIVAFFSILCGIGYFIVKLLLWDSFSLGMAPLVIGMFFLAAVQLLSIGVLGEYIVAILAQTKNKPHVIERERINFDADNV
jgi:glycosyltransferase involved in cell wall biosynthesis